MTYQETLEYLFGQLPMYQRVGAAAYKADLNTTWQLLEALGNPQKSEVRYIHVAGTNGKGSVCHMLASVLQEAGYKIGLFTSPHLKDFRERVRINGKPISASAVVDFVEKHRKVFERLRPSFFEMTAALAFTHFGHEAVDFAILETGMGGRLDSTNVVVPEVAVITNIGMDHTQFLGDTIAAIASEKAGIIKSGRPVVAGPMRPEALSVIEQTAAERKCQLYVAKVKRVKYNTDLSGQYQNENLATALSCIDVLRQSGVEISEQSISLGLSKVVSNTGLLGRWQQLSDQPRIICDVGHNADGIDRILNQLANYAYDTLHVVFGMVSDKQADDILALLPKDARYYFCAANVPRALPVDALQTAATRAGLKGDAYQGVRAALDAAKSEATDNDLIFVGGSLFVVAEVL